MISSAQIAANLETIRQRVDSACQRSGRDPQDITILGASKSQPPERLQWAWEAGLRVYGENRVQEALMKMPQLPAGIEWHLLGPLQSNKVKKVVPAFVAVHSIDRLKIARALDREAAKLGQKITGFLEINLATEETKHGFLPTVLPNHLDELAQLDSLQIVGLMAIPPFEKDPQASRVWFRQLRALRDTIREREDWQDFPGLLSMGMSHDYDVAVEEGATHVRIGTSLFGPREV
jgi:pyridoxal phosphate enzyme (YggS family)